MASRRSKSVTSNDTGGCKRPTAAGFMGNGPGGAAVFSDSSFLPDFPLAVVLAFKGELFMVVELDEVNDIIVGGS